LREEGRTDFDNYRYDPAEELETDLFVESGPRTTNESPGSG
jgi:hypothetical protein